MADGYGPMALMYETRGSCEREPVDCVVIVRTVSSPMVTRAGIASTEIQNATHDNITERPGTQIK